MSGRATGMEKLRIELQRLSRGDLLIIAMRAIELVPQAKLKPLLGDFVQLDAASKGTAKMVPVLDEVRKFHAESIAGRYNESFAVNSKNFTEKSRGTEAFIAEFDRLLCKCLRAAENEPRTPVRDAFEHLFGLLRRIDEGNGDIIFFADEGGSWQVGVDWHAALPAYFRCLADSASAEEFAQSVDEAIRDFADYERPRHLTAARRAANATQRAALRALPAARR